MSTSDSMDALSRVCVKIYGPEPRGLVSDAAAFVPIFHEWIRNGSLDLVLIDVADYAHAPDSPGIMLVAHDVSFALDRSDGRFGLLAQRRLPLPGGAAHAVETTLRQVLTVVDKLEREPSLVGALSFDRSSVRVEANDRLRGPNTDDGYAAFEPVVRAACQAVFPALSVSTARVRNDPRDRLAVDVRLVAAGAVSPGDTRAA